MTPRVTVVMAVYNGQRHLRPAIESILGQSYTDFEFIAIDDGSEDDSYKIIRDLGRQDGRLVPVKNEINIGLTASLNKGLDLAQGEYFARQDADDISLQDRLAVEVEFLDDRPDVCLVGAATGLIDEGGRFLGRRRGLNIAGVSRRALLQHNFLAHGTIMARRQMIVGVGGYREAFRYAQDYDLWLRMSELCGVHLLEQILYWRRATLSGLSGVRSVQQAKFRALARQLAAERREYGKEITGLSVEGAEIASQSPSAGRAASLGYLGYAREMLSVRQRRRAFYYLVLSIIRHPLNPAPWQWLAGAAARRIRDLVR
jgi:hypothetical protein